MVDIGWFGLENAMTSLRPVPLIVQVLNDHYKSWHYDHPYGTVSIYVFDDNVYEVYDNDTKDPAYLSYSLETYSQHLRQSGHRPQLLDELEALVPDKP